MDSTRTEIQTASSKAGPAPGHGMSPCGPLGKGLKPSFSSVQVRSNHMLLSQGTLCLGRPSGPGLCVSNKLPGAAGAAGPLGILVTCRGPSRCHSDEHMSGWELEMSDPSRGQDSPK